MNDEQMLTPTEREFEAALGGLRPSSATIDRDRMMFIAGQRSMRRWSGSRVWPAMTAMLTVACVWLATVRVGDVVTDGTPSWPTMTMSEIDQEDHDRWVGQASYVKLRNEVLAHGLDALPEPAVGSKRSYQPLTVEGLLEMGDKS